MSPRPTRPKGSSTSVGPIDMRAQAEGVSALRADTPTQLALVDVAEADWRNRGACRVGRTGARNIRMTVWWRSGFPFGTPRAFLPLTLYPSLSRRCLIPG